MLSALDPLPATWKIGLPNHATRPLRNTLQYLFLFFGCLHMVGGPHSLIQVYAWANMIVSYSQDSSLGDAVADTFSGEKPCSLCKRIASAKAEESDRGNENAPILSPSKRIFQDLFPPSVASLADPFSHPFPQPVFPATAVMISPPASGPPVPPPRC